MVILPVLPSFVISRSVLIWEWRISSASMYLRSEELFFHSNVQKSCKGQCSGLSAFQCVDFMVNCGAFGENTIGSYYLESSAVSPSCAVQTRTEIIELVL